MSSHYSTLQGAVKTNTRKRNYHVSVSADGKTCATVMVQAEGVRDALKKAYEKVSGWQRVPDEPVD